MNTIRVLKGQVWHWRDPLYGDKCENKPMNGYYESVTRFSRYVIIIQDESNADNHSMLAIPCSSTRRYETDIEIELYSNFNGVNKTYAQTRKVFPVHPKSLNKYICTLDKETIQKLDSIIVSLIAPNIVDQILKNTESALINSLYSIRQIGLNTLASKDFVEVEEDESFIIEEDDLTDTVIKKGKVELIEETEVEVEEPKRVAANFKWSDEAKREFVKFYEEYGKEATAEKYKIKLESATTYNGKFIKEFKKREIESAVKEPEPKLSITMNEYRQKVNTMCTKIINELKTASLYKIYHKGFKGKNQIGKDRFYTILKNSINSSLLSIVPTHDTDIINIKETDEEFELLKNVINDKIYLSPKVLYKIRTDFNSKVSIKKDTLKKIEHELRLRYFKK